MAKYSEDSYDVPAERVYGDGYGEAQKRAPEVPRVLERLDKEVEITADSVARLVTALASVLQQDTPRAVDEINAKGGMASPLGSRLDSIADKLANTNSALLNILGRIEV